MVTLSWESLASAIFLLWFRRSYETTDHARQQATLLADELGVKRILTVVQKSEAINP